MAHIAGGSFFGYREIAPSVKKFRRAIRLKGKKWGRAPTFFNFETMGPIPYGYASFSGRAGDAFPDALTPFPFFARVIQINVTEHAADLIFSYDGSTLGDIIEMDGPSVHIMATRGFMIRNTVPGLPAKYQLLAGR